VKSPTAFPRLSAEGRIGTCLLRNRLIMPLYPTKYATDSLVNERMIEFYRARARGGVAMIVLDCPCLDYPAAYKGPQELRFDEPAYAETILRLLEAIHAEGAKAFMQLNYPKERFFDRQVPGAKLKGDRWVAPLAKVMTSEEAGDIIGIMARGAARARELCYDGVEIQASYGDFISQLLSPLSNKRTDEYGGSLENRVRFLISLIREVKKQAGDDYPLMVKLVCDEFIEGGLTLEESTLIAEHAARAGADAILASGGNKTTKAMTIPTHYQPAATLLHLARGIRRAVTTPVIAIGKINTPELAEKILEEGEADFIAMARPLIADPDLPRKAMEGRAEDIRRCLYDLEDCADKGVKGIGRTCTVNPFAGLEYRMKVTPAETRKKIVVIGGGPAGMQAAVTARERGHEVVLFEKEETLGGQLRLASRAPFKGEMEDELRYLEHRVDESGVRTRCGREATVGDVLAEKPDAVIVAVGSRDFRPSLPGAEEPFVFNARAVFEGLSVPGERVTVIGGGDIGCETADLLSEQGKKVVVIEASDEVMRRMKELPRQVLSDRLKAKGVTVITGARVTSIAKGLVTVDDGKGGSSQIENDSVIVAIGSVPSDSPASSLGESVREIHVVGDAREPGNLGSALRSATETALKL